MGLDAVEWTGNDAGMMRETMRAMVLRDFGAPDVFGERMLPVPVPGPGEVLVRVRASSVNPVDGKIRSGMLRAIAPPDPVVLGCDVAGEVVACGAGVGTFRAGDAVYGCAGGVKGLPGALAEYMVADAALLAPKPAELDWEEAAALPLVTITAWEGLIDRAGVREGQRVLIHAGAGGVGHVALQLAAARGAQVWTTVSGARKAALAKSLADVRTIDYRSGTVEEYVQSETGGEGFGIVMDTVGGENVGRSLAAAAVSGTVVSISTRTAVDLSPMHAKGLTLHVVFMLLNMLHGRGRERHGQILREAGQLVAAGKLRPLLDARRFGFGEVAAAHAYLESGAAEGKIVLTGFAD
jgi:NADPH2:quinone reductase